MRHNSLKKLIIKDGDDGDDDDNDSNERFRMCEKTPELLCHTID